MEKIASGQSVNLGQFYAQLERLHIDTLWAKDQIQRVRDKNDKYFLTLESELAELIEARLINPKATRSQAGSKNQSHAVKVNGSFLLVRQGPAHPEVVIFQDDGTHSDIRQNLCALIIENRQNFLSISRTQQFLLEQCQMEISEEMDVIFGAGMEIGNTLHGDFLKRYTKLIFLLDIDEGGLRIAHSLSKMVPDAEHVFLLPDDIMARLAKSSMKVGEETLERINALSMRAPFLQKVARLIIKYAATLEQESYLE